MDNAPPLLKKAGKVLDPPRTGSYLISAHHFDRGDDLDFARWHLADGKKAHRFFVDRLLQEAAELGVSRPPSPVPQ